MSQPDFSDGTLVVLGHGTTLNEESSAPVYQHAAAIRNRKVFAAVREGFWKQEPQVVKVLAELTTPRVFIAPLFISEGYFSEEMIPKELAFRGEAEKEFSRTQHRGAQTLIYCKPIGTHDRMTEVVLARAREIVAQFPFPRAPQPNDTTLFIAGHGTERNENSRRAIERQQDLIRGLGLYANVQAVFMEEEPRIQNLYQIAQTKNVIVVPFFISDGLHVREDIPMLLGEPKSTVEKRLKSGQPTWRNPTERKGKLVWYTPSVGTEPRLTEVILERVSELAT